MIHIDIKYVKLSTGGAAYLLILVDDFSRYRAIVSLPKRSDQLMSFKEVVLYWENITQRKIQCVRKDGSGENFNEDLLTFLHSRGAFEDVPPPYSPQLNGVAERSIRIIFDRVRAMMLWANAPQRFWMEAAFYAVHILNMLPSESLPDDSIPSILFNHEQPKFQDLRAWGCRVIYKKPSIQVENTTLDPRGTEGIFVGYTKYWRIYDPALDRIILTHDLIFYEDTPGWANQVASELSIPRPYTRIQYKLRSLSGLTLWDYYWPKPSILTVIQEEFKSHIALEVFQSPTHPIIENGFCNGEQALLHDWPSHSGYVLVIPPLDVVDETIAKIFSEECDAIVLVPYLPQQIWFKALMDFTNGEHFLLDPSSSDHFYTLSETFHESKHYVVMFHITQTYQSLKALKVLPKSGYLSCQNKQEAHAREALIKFSELE